MGTQALRAALAPELEDKALTPDEVARFALSTRAPEEIQTLAKKATDESSALAVMLQLAENLRQAGVVPPQISADSNRQFAEIAAYELMLLNAPNSPETKRMGQEDKYSRYGVTYTLR